jgi:hypothetical protein
MDSGLSERIRNLARENYVAPAIKSGKDRFSIRVRDIRNDLRTEAGGFPPSHNAQICSALKTAKFLRENGLELESVDGPPSGQSSTVVFHYRVNASAPRHVGPGIHAATEQQLSSAEDPSARAFRLTEKLRGILKEELAEYGGAEGFMRWIRSDDDEEAA